MPEFTVEVPSDFPDSIRLDKYIASLPNGMNRSKLKSGLVEIIVNHKKAKLSQKVKAKDIIKFSWEDNIPDDIEPENIPLDIIYEDKNVTVVNKKQGMVTHPACNNWSGTLVNALLYHWGRESIHQLKETEAKESEIIQKRRPGIVHRLDKETSGIIITAKNRDSEEFLQNQFKTKSNIKKEYICICCGRLPQKAGVIETQIIRDPKDRKKFKAAVNTSEGKYAKTIYHCISCYGNFSLVRIRIKTGRTHQIRVHMKHLGCPILGDSIYNGNKSKLFPNATLMLHSYKLKILLPEESQIKTFRTKTPKRFIEVQKKLKKLYPKVILP